MFLIGVGVIPIIGHGKEVTNQNCWWRLYSQSLGCSMESGEKVELYIQGTKNFNW